jgi:simple sugar transport system permease protein
LFAPPDNIVGTALVLLAGALAGAAWIALAGALRQLRGVNETISSLLLAYTAIALFKHFVEGPMRDPASLNKPSTRPIAEALRIGTLPGADIHWGLVFGIAACVLLGLWLFFSSSGFATRVVGGNARAARLVGLPSTRIVIVACAIGGACAGLAGGIEVVAVHTAANASLIAGLGYAGILVSFVARHNPWVVIPVAVLFGGFGSAGSLLQRRLDVPDASVLVLQGFAFLLILASEALRGRMFAESAAAPAPVPAPVRIEAVDVPQEPSHTASTSPARTGVVGEVAPLIPTLSPDPAQA